MAKYLIETTFFVQPHRSYNPIDIAGSYWEMVKKLISDSLIISVDKVKGEIYNNEDELTYWVKENVDDSFFHDTQNSDIIENYSEVANWAVNKDQYKQKAIHDFLEFENADAWLVAYGITHKKIIVTYEESRPESKKIIKIPDVCNAFDVDCIKPNEMFRELGVEY